MRKFCLLIVAIFLFSTLCFAQENKLSIQQAIEETIKLKQNFAEITNKTETSFQENKEKIIKKYDEQIQSSYDNKEKDSWETEKEYNTRIEKNNNLIENLKIEKENAIFEEKRKTIEQTLLSLSPLITKLQYFQTEKFYDKSANKAQLLNIEKINADEKHFTMNIEYEKTKYSLKYDFSKVGRDKAQLMCQTQNQFTIEPLFSVGNQKLDILKSFTINGKEYVIEEMTIVNNIDNSIKNVHCNNFDKKNKSFSVSFEYVNKQHVIIFDFSNIEMKEAKQIYKNPTMLKIIPNKYKKEFIEKELTAFNIKHVGANEAQILNIAKKINPFDEINQFNIYENKYNKLKELKTINKKLFDTIKEFKSEKRLNKFTGIINRLEEYNKSTNENKFLNIDDIKEYIYSLKTQIISVSAGYRYTVGLRKDGTCLATGKNDDGQCNVEDWKDIIAISAGDSHTVGLKKDGTCVATGNNDENQCNVQNWKNIVDVSACYGYTVGLRKDGTVVVAGGKTRGTKFNLKNWTNIIAISAGCDYIVGLRKDGTCVATGDNYYGQRNVQAWKDIVAIDTNGNTTIGVKKDGTCVAIGDNLKEQANIQSWDNISTVIVCLDHTIGLKKDGTVIAVGNIAYNQYGQCDVQNFRNIVVISANTTHTVCLNDVGRFTSAGSTYNGERDLD